MEYLDSCIVKRLIQYKYDAYMSFLNSFKISFLFYAYKQYNNEVAFTRGILIYIMYAETIFLPRYAI